MPRQPKGPFPTPEQIRSALAYDPETGLFRWRYRRDASLRWNTQFAGCEAGSISDMGYIVIEIDGWPLRGHRVAGVMMTGTWPNERLDHKNRSRADNRWDNIRPASASNNNHNRGIQKNNTSGFKGVSRHRSSWRAHIKINGKGISLGSFPTPESAFAAYRDAAIRLHGEFVPAEIAAK